MKRNKSIALILFVVLTVCRPGFGFEKRTYTDARGEREYQTIKIGIQEWFAENFAYLPHVSPMGRGDGIWVGGYNGRDIAEAKKMPQYLFCS